MAAQGEREPGGLVVCNSLLGPMAQDIPEQDIVMGEQELPPQMDPKLEMGAAAAAADFATPPLLRQIPSPTPSKTATDNGGSVPLPPLCLQIVEACTQAMRGEIRAWTKAFVSEARTTADIMAPPSAATNELKGSAPAGE